MNISGMFNKCFNNLKTSYNKNEPTIFFVAGVIGVGVTIAAAIKGTWEAKDIVEDCKANLKKIEEKKDNADKKKEIAAAVGKTGLKLATTYGLTIISATATVCAFSKSYGRLKNDNIGLAATCATLGKGFKEYRKNVVEKFGEEVDKQLLYGGEVTEVTVPDPENPDKVKTEKRRVYKENPGPSMYHKYFTRMNPNWHDDMELNEFFVDQIQRFLNQEFKYANVDFIELNKAYEQCGFKKEAMGMKAGWLKNNPDGDNYIKIYHERCLLPDENGELQEALLLDFNVDGDIYELMC